LSSKDSETVSEAPSVAGSDNSHSSAAPAHRNLTLLLRNIPETMASSMSTRPHITSEIAKYVCSVISADGGLPIDQKAIKYSASFSQPKQAPPGCCWLNFKYTIEGKRVNRLRNTSFDDDKIYSLKEFMEHYRQSGQPEKSDLELQNMWVRCEDAVFAAEKMLAGGGRGARPISIATYFLDRIKAADRPKRREVEEKHAQDPQSISLEDRKKYIDVKGKTWTTLTLGHQVLSVEFMRMPPR